MTDSAEKIAKSIHDDVAKSCGYDHWNNKKLRQGYIDLAQACLNARDQIPPYQEVIDTGVSHIDKAVEWINRSIDNLSLKRLSKDEAIKKAIRCLNEAKAEIDIASPRPGGNEHDG